MKKAYQEPHVEAFALGTEQSIMTVSTGVLALIVSSDPTSGIETLDGWDSTESWK